MKRIRLNIGRKVLVANAILIVLFLVNATVSLIQLNANEDRVQISSEVLNPSIVAIEDFILMITKSKMHISNWVLVRSDKDKEELNKIHALEFPTVKDRLSSLKRLWGRPDLVQKLDPLIIRFDELLGQEKKTVQTLSRVDSYSYNPYSAYEQEAKPDLTNIFIPESELMISQLRALADSLDQQQEVLKREIADSLFRLRLTLVILALFTMGFTILFVVASHQMIVQPIGYLSRIIEMLSKGQVPKMSRKYEAKMLDDEIGDMAKYVAKLVYGVEATMQFSESIGKGDYEKEYKPLSDKDQLGTSLLKMRDNLITIAEDAKIREWTSSGIAMFADILRKNYDTMEGFYYEVLFNLVKYLGANQGAVFIVSVSNKENKRYMSMESCYAWDKKKDLEKDIFIGEGLAGQAWQEERTIYVTDVPDSFIRIKSGLGDKNPNALLLVPMLFNEAIYGVIELATFNEFKGYQIAFAEKIAESFASTLATTQINIRTKQLLHEAHIMAEQLKAQEDGMRQNVAELQATQEQMQLKQEQLLASEQRSKELINEMQIKNEQLRVKEEAMRSTISALETAQQDMRYTQRELARSEVNLNALINNTDDYIVLLDVECRTLITNDAFRDSRPEIEFKTGASFIDALPKAEKLKWRGYFDRGLGGERFSFIEKSEVKLKEVYRQYFINPVENSIGEVVGVSFFARDVTREKVGELENQRLLKETQEQYEQMSNQGSELLKYMEDIKATQEELKLKEASLQALINSTDDAILLINQEYQVVSINEVMRKRYEKFNINVGDHILEKFGKLNQEWKSYYDRGLSGEKFNLTRVSTVEKEMRHYFINPVKNENGEVIGVSVFSRPISSKNAPKA